MGPSTRDMGCTHASVSETIMEDDITPFGIKSIASAVFVNK
jgi:hypothetical protein